jgi:intracellular sulfur oxidation DsrE/DsrF family protein
VDAGKGAIMTVSHLKDRRGFLTRTMASAAALAAAVVPARASRGIEQSGGGGDWTKEVTGTHRCLFDFPRHGNGIPLLHVLNYLNTYATAEKAASGQVGAVGTFYGIGAGSSIALGFNDAMWARYALGEYHTLKDAAGKPYTRNVFQQPTKDDVHLLMQAINSPTIPMFADIMPAIGIANLQKMGTKFLMCNNALGAWIAELEARGKGKAADIERDLRANLVPGVTIVPAMVIAIEQAQAAGIRYNRQ